MILSSLEPLVNECSIWLRLIMALTLLGKPKRITKNILHIFRLRQ